MAEYKYNRFLQMVADPTLDLASPAGAPAPLSGIYRCTVCGRESVAHNGAPLPGPTHHSHGPDARPIAWQCVVASTQA